MKQKQIFCRLRELAFALALLCTANAFSKTPVRLIFDTDMAPDYDDVGALALLHALADFGEVEILATVSSNKCPTCVPCIEVINTYFGRPDIPVGCAKGDAQNITTWHKGLRWTDELPKRYPHRTVCSEDSEDAVRVYRRILSQQPDASVTIVTVGFFTNLSNLLASSGDEYSRLSGEELVKRKVKKLVSMAGTLPEGREFNVYSDTKASQTVMSKWPTPILLSDSDIGDAILTGKKLAASDIKHSPVVDVYSVALPQDNPEGRMSWDQTAVLVAVRGAKKYFNTEKGTMTVFDDGSDKWTKDSKGNHAHLLFKMPKDELQNVIESLMLHQPSKK